MATTRKAMPTIETLQTFVFYGIDGEECEDLIHAVRLHARVANRMHDHVYMARWASSCMVGAALRWYIALPKEVKYDWDELEQALAAEYPINNEARSRSSPGVIRRGRLKAVCNDLNRAGYISNKPDIMKSLVPTSSISEALIVEWATPFNDGDSRLRILNQEPIDGKYYDLLGVSFHSAGPLGHGINMHGSLTAATLSATGQCEHALKGGGERKVDMWRLAPDGFISMHWDDGSTVHELIAAAHTAIIRVMSPSDLPAFNKAHFPGDPSTPVRLFLEPLA